jgi:hypothetical protein
LLTIKVIVEDIALSMHKTSFATIYLCVLIKHMYVYCSYNGSNNKYLNFKIYYPNIKLDISILKIIFESNILILKY